MDIVVPPKVSSYSVHRPIRSLIKHNYYFTCRSRPPTSHFSRPTTSTTIRETPQPQRSAVSEKENSTHTLLTVLHYNTYT